MTVTGMGPPDDDHPGLPRLVLASASPRRAALLDLLGLDYVVEPAEVDETQHEGEDPITYVGRVARAKAAARAGEDRLVLAADTTVALDGDILAKPADADDARRMLQRLSGRRHEVHTGVVARLGDRVAARTDTTRVRFVELTEHEIDWYVATGEPLDKAGAYGIQGAGGAFVADVEGNVQNVIGLSLATVHELVRRLGVDLFDWAR